AEPVAVGDALLDQAVDAEQDVLKVAAAPVLDVGLAELLAEAAGASRVGAEHGEALPSEYLQRIRPALHDDARGELRLEGQRVLALRTAVNVGEQRVFCPLLVADRKDEDALTLDAVLALPRHRLHLAEGDAVEVRVAVGASLGAELVQRRD